MKRVILTSAVILLASFNFYAKQIITTNELNYLKSKTLYNKNESDAILLNRSRMDIGQADIK